MAEPRHTQDNPSSGGTGGMNPPDPGDRSHPVATGVGALGGAAAGAAVGAMGGPVGSVVGAVTGAVVGGLGGNAVGRAFDPAEEDRYWRENYAREPYYETGRSYDDYGPAYSLGMSGRSTYGGRFDDAEDRLSQQWEQQRGGSSLSWQQAREPSRAAWQRIDEQYPTTGDGQLMGSGQTYSASGGTGSGERNTIRSSSHRLDISSGEDTSLSNLPSSDSSMRGSEAFDRRQRERSDADSGAFGAVGSAQSASAGEISDTDDVIDVLNDLVECCRDGEYGFNLCAEHVQNPELKQQMSHHADECRTAARELMERIRALGGDVDDGGSMMGSMHRGWVSMKGTLSGYSDRAMAEEAERGEDNALGRYRKALEENLPADIQALVQRQYQGVQRNHDEMKRWRDRLQDRV